MRVWTFLREQMENPCCVLRMIESVVRLMTYRGRFDESVFGIEDGMR